MNHLPIKSKPRRVGRPKTNFKPLSEQYKDASMRFRNKSTIQRVDYINSVEVDLIAPIKFSIRIINSSRYSDSQKINMINKILSIRLNGFYNLLQQNKFPKEATLEHIKSGWQ